MGKGISAIAVSAQSVLHYFDQSQDINDISAILDGIDAILIPYMQQCIRKHTRLEEDETMDADRGLDCILLNLRQTGLTVSQKIDRQITRLYQMLQVNEQANSEQAYVLTTFQAAFQIRRIEKNMADQLTRLADQLVKQTHGKQYSKSRRPAENIRSMIYKQVNDPTQSCVDVSFLNRLQKTIHTAEPHFIQHRNANTCLGTLSKIKGVIAKACRCLTQCFFPRTKKNPRFSQLWTPQKPRAAQTAEALLTVIQKPEGSMHSRCG